MRSWLTLVTLCLVFAGSFIAGCEKQNQKREFDEMLEATHGQRPVEYQVKVGSAPGFLTFEPFLAVEKHSVTPENDSHPYEIVDSDGNKLKTGNLRASDNPEISVYCKTPGVYTISIKPRSNVLKIRLRGKYEPQ